MCWAMAAMFAAQAANQIGSAFIGASEDASAYEKKMKALQTEASAIDQSTIFKYQMTNLQQQQIQDKGAAMKGELGMREAEAVGTAGAAAASAGVEGNSVQQLINSFAATTGREKMFVDQQTENEITQSRMEQKGFNMDAAARKQALSNQIPDHPQTKIFGRFLTAALGIGDAYMKSTTKTEDGSGFLGRRWG